MYAYVYTPPYEDCLRRMARNGRAVVALQEALIELGRKPFGNPKLRTHDMQGRTGPKTFITDVGGRKGWRLIWQLLDRTIVLLLFGEHDIEQQAERLRYDYVPDDDTGGVRLVAYDLRAGELPAVAAEHPAEPGSLFMAWNDRELADLGFADHELVVLRRLEHENDLFALEPRMRPETFERALELLVAQTPAGQTAAEDRTDRATATRRVEEVVDAEERELGRKVTAPQSRKDFAVVPADALAEVLTKPIEDWMVFLHPDQLRLTERPFSGTARVRGGAGTGKTVVALHRARHLAETYPGKVLFATYVRNLPTVFAELFSRLAPELDGRVEFKNVHAWAYGFVKRQGRPFELDPAKVNRAFDDAWRTAVPREGVIASRGYGKPYYREELDWVIKGRGLCFVEDYLALARTGRGSPLTQPHRREVWTLYEAYQRNLRTAGVHDFADVLLIALELAEQGHADGLYDAVVIDEAQDLTEVGVRLLHRLAGCDRRDGLFLVGDGQQSVYPGGFSLGSVGIDVRGRSALLKVNYRNTRQILQAAQRIVEERPFDDLDESFEQGRRDMDVLRDGPSPQWPTFTTTDDHDEALVLALTAAADDPTVGPGDLAVLLPTYSLVQQYASRIAALGLRTQKLEKYDGRPNDAVKVGTYQRAKGLEFKQVFLPRLEPSTVGEHARRGEDADTHAERLELIRRRLFVAMTRARDAVWAGSVGEPTSLLRRTP